MTSASTNHSVKTDVNTLLNALENVFQASNEAERLFLAILRECVITHSEKSAKNRDAYFQGNRAADAGQSLLVIGEHLSKQTTLLGLLIWFILSAISILQPLNLRFIYALLYYLALGAGSFAIALLTARQKTCRKNLLLRRHGETWVRHTCMLTKYYNEILRFINAVAPYNTLPASDRKALFQEQILQLFAENAELFSEHMKNTCEFIE